MPRIFYFYVVNPEKVSVEPSSSELEDSAARWFQVETSAHGFLAMLGRLEQLLGEDLIGGRLGVFSPRDTMTLRDKLVAVSPETLERIEDDEAIDTAYWALRDTVTEATRRGYAMAIVMAG